MTMNIQPSHPELVHTQVVRSYFHKVLDQGDEELIEDLFNPHCVMHRPGGTVVGLDAVRGVVAHRKETFSQFGTEIHDLFGSGDRVAARLTHRGVGCGIWRLRPGSFDISGKTVTWNSIAIFRFEDEKIVEEWVTRDELGVILQLGLFQKALK
jgi:predicted ester cyclase